MEGAALGAKDRLDIATYTAWHTAIFALNGYSGKLKGKSLADYLTKHGSKPKRSKLADAHAFFGRLQAQGIPISSGKIN
jgi:hypothetical protein